MTDFQSTHVDKPVYWKVFERLSVPRADFKLYSYLYTTIQKFLTNISVKDWDFDFSWRLDLGWKI